MFCSDCGTKADGKFCWKCGAKLHDGPDAVETLPLAAPSSPPPLPPAAPQGHVAIEPVGGDIVTGDWSHEARYDLLIRHPDVRERIARNAKQAKSWLTGDQFLEICDSLGATAVPMVPLLKVVMPIYERMGIKTGKTRAQAIAQPVGSTIVAVLCALARQGMTLTEVEQAEDGCVFRATMPSTVFAYSGEIVLSVMGRPPGTMVEATTTIKGQLYDWGASRSRLNTLFDDLARIPA